MVTVSSASIRVLGDVGFHAVRRPAYRSDSLGDYADKGLMERFTYPARCHGVNRSIQDVYVSVRGSDD